MDNTMKKSILFQRYYCQYVRGFAGKITVWQSSVYWPDDFASITSLDKGIQGKEAKKVLPTLHKTPPNGTIGGVFVCGGKSLNPGRQGMRPRSRQGGICKHGRRN
nr:hypothetical protein [uncultured Oscillibacter sp.]